jgi:hypothetical protein
MRKMVSRTEDKEGRLISGGNGWSKSETDYDEDGRAVTEWKFGCEASGAPAFRTDIEWHKSGVCKRRVRQAFDAARKPLPFISTGTGARFEEDFDEIERLERIYETGFDEKTLGFSSREATFSATVLQSVTHRRADGTALDAVRVIITSVIPQQPKAAELRAGDQLLAANDKPVTSAYHWVYGINFSGGWIEVLREGRRIRIEGFTPAKLGVLLEDRAPAAIQ